MSVSFQGLPPPGAPPSVIYPTIATTTPGLANSHDQDGSSSHSNGSFGMVFAVLAIILVISVLACVISRFCNRKSINNNNNSYLANKVNNIPSENQNRNQNHNHNQIGKNHMHGRPQLRDQDLEFGSQSKEGDTMHGFEPKIQFKTRVPMANHGDFRGMER